MPAADMPGNATADADLRDIPPHPSDILLDRIVGFLAPLFTSSSASDHTAARLAAIETLASHQARSQAELLNIAQIIAFGMAAMDSLRLSMTPDLPIPTILKLRSAANALNRSAQQHARALQVMRKRHAPAQRTPTPDVVQDPVTDTQTQAAIHHARTTISAAPQSAARPTTQQLHQLHWAQAMTQVADELAVPNPDLAPERRNSDLTWSNALRSSASNLAQAAGNLTPINPKPA